MNAVVPSLGISRRYLHDEVADRLRGLIRSGELEPKARVNELELAQKFGISRTPLREAIKILATEGLLELLPNRGARVASISDAELEEVLEVIASLEATAAELACRHIGQADLRVIEETHAAMLSAWRMGDEPTYIARNREIHDAIFRASRNATLRGIYQNLEGRIQRARYAAPKTPEQWQRAVDEHIRMLALLRARDGEALGRLMRDHIRGKRPAIEAAYG